MLKIRTGSLPGRLYLQFGSKRGRAVEKHLRKCPHTPAEIRLVALWVDVRGSSTLMAELPPAVFHRLMSKLFETCHSTALQRGAILEKFMGDGVLILFPGSKSHDSLNPVPGDPSRGRTDPCERAVRTAAEIATEFDKWVRGEEFASVLTSHNAAHPDVCTGLAVVAEKCHVGSFGPLVEKHTQQDLPIEYSAIGRAPTHAARACDSARANYLEQISRETQQVIEKQELPPIGDVPWVWEQLTDRNQRKRSEHFYKKGWTVVRNRSLQNSVILVDESMGRPRFFGHLDSRMVIHNRGEEEWANAGSSRTSSSWRR